MPTKNPRVHVVLERPLFSRLKGLARKNGLSMSLEARELIREVISAPAKRTSRVYTGRHIRELIGGFRLGRAEPDEWLAKQAHG